MNVPWDVVLRPDQRENPVVYSETIAIPESITGPPDDVLREIFPVPSYRLQTWGRTTRPDGSTILTLDPHWIAVRKGTPLHVDPKYPRYSYHLKIRVAPGFFVQGISREPFPLVRGTYYVLDTHSPHQVFTRTRSKNDLWNIAVSLDGHRLLSNHHQIIPRLLEFAEKNPRIKP